MPRRLIVLALMAPISAFAQPLDHRHMMMIAPIQSGATPTQIGQSAFAAIEEIVRLLEADPKTDWSKVNIEALRQHLIDMDNVTLHSDVRSEPVDGGVRFVVTGPGAVRDSLQRMTATHAAMMEGVGGWSYKAAMTETGADLTVLVPAKDRPKLQALGFIGVLTRGMHHQMHHWMIARGEPPR